MPVNYSVPVLTSRLQQVINAIDAGASNGFMRFLDSGGNVLSSFQLSRPCGVAFNGVMTFNGLSLIDPSAAGSGNATAARCEDSTGNIILSGLVVNGNGTIPPDIIMTPTNVIVAGQTVAVTAATITGN